MPEFFRRLKRTRIQRFAKMMGLKYQEQMPVFRELPGRPSAFLDASLNARSFSALLIGACAPISLKLIGVMYAGELLLLVVALWVLLTSLGNTKFWSPVAIRFITLLILGLASFVVTDLVRETPSENYLRGWSRMAFIATNFVGLYFLFRKSSSAIIYFFLGYKLVSIALFFINPPSYNNFLAQWKFELSGPVTIISLCLLAMAGKAGIRITPYVLGALGALHFALDYRSLGLICLMISAMLLAVKRTRKGKMRVDAKVLILTSVACTCLAAYLYIAGQGHYAERRSLSNSWRYGTSIATLKGIARSPIIGNGSWYTDDQMEGWRNEAMGVSRITSGSERFSAHSEILEGWYEGGILVEFFFLYYGSQLARVLKMLFKRRVDNLSALFVFIAMTAAWGLFASPLNGFSRLDIASAMAIFCYLLSERREQRDARTLTQAYFPTDSDLQFAGAPLPGRR